jgi:hypothetical protein
MTKDEELYQEEQVQNLKEINKQLKGSAIIPIPQLPEEIKSKVINSITAEITNKINIDEKPFEALSNDFRAELEKATGYIVKAVLDSVKEPLSEITVKNIEQAKTKDVNITNFDELKKHISELTKVIIANQPEINIDKQDIQFPTAARNPISVRLSDGKSFYNAIAALASGGLSKAAQANLERLAFNSANELKVTGVGGGGGGGGDGAILDGADSGIKATVKDVSTDIIGTDNGLVTNTVIHGLSSAGGGTYVDVKVQPSGSLMTAIGDIGDVAGQDTMANSLPVTIASNQSAVPITDNGGSLTVDGTITANIGTSGSLALDATLTGGTTKAIARGGAKGTTVAADITSNPIDVNTQALHVDGSKVTQPVSGTITANAGTGSFTVAQATASNLKVDLSGTGANATAIKVDNSAVTQPVSGTITANAGTGNFTVAQSTATNLNAQVAGDIASGATDSGNPVKVGGKYNLTAPTYTNGQRSELQTDSRGTLKVILAPGTNVQPFSADNADAVAATATVATPINVTRNTVYNGTTWDRMPGDTTGIKIQDGGNSITVDGIVAATKSGTWTLDANSGVDIGDVTINNASGASAVNIQDGGNSITVDGTVTANQGGTWTVQPGNTANTTAWLVTNQNFSTSTVTSVAGSATSVQLLASTSGRKAAYFYNDSTADCYLKLGTTASTSSFTVKMVSNSFYELPQPCYTGRIDAIWSSATGNIRITEIT